MNLKQLLQTAEYAGLSDADAAALANEQRHAITVNAYHTYRSLAGDGGIGTAATRRLIATMDGAADSDPLVSEMRHCLRGNGNPPGINANDAATQGMLGQFATSEQLPLTAEDADAIKALADSTESDADRHSLGTVEEKHVRWVREGIR